MPDYPMGVQYDEQGRPFTYVGGTSRRSYISPVAMGGQAPEDTTGIFRQGPQWNNHTGNWETPIDWGNILNIGIAGGLGAGAASAAGLFGGGAAGTAGSVAADPALVGALPSAQIGTGAATLPSAAASVGGAAGGGLPSWLGPALSVGTGLVGRMAGGGGGNNQIPIPPELQQLLSEATRRTMNQGPLSDAITQQALAGLPNRGGR